VRTAPVQTPEPVDLLQLRARGGCASPAQAEADVLAHVQVREQRVVLEQIGHVALLRQIDAGG
jgi:hypothetical protein